MGVHSNLWKILKKIEIYNYRVKKKNKTMTDVNYKETFMYFKSKVSATFNSEQTFAAIIIRKSRFTSHVTISSSFVTRRIFQTVTTTSVQTVVSISPIITLYYHYLKIGMFSRINANVFISGDIFNLPIFVIFKMLTLFFFRNKTKQMFRNVSKLF